MPNGFPCPACGDANAALYQIADRPEGFDSGHASSGCAYACAACITAARMVAGDVCVMQSNDLTSTSHQ